MISLSDLYKYTTRMFLNRSSVLNLLLTTSVFLITTRFALCCCVQHYEVPEPVIEVFQPRGFKVKIPHSDGISVFAFHGKINEEMDALEAGYFSKDVLKRTGDFWVFEDRRVRLDIGDKIYFWLFVIKNGLGYRYDDGKFTVQEYTERGPTLESDPDPRTTPSAIPTSHTTRRTTPEGQQSSTTPIYYDPPTTPFNPIRICEGVILNITASLLALREEVNLLKSTNEILREIAQKHPASARTLKFEGMIPTNEDAVSTVKEIIKQKLALSIEIVDAEWNKKGGITFEVASLDDKVKIIQTAKEKLRYSRIYLTY